MRIWQIANIFNRIWNAMHIAIIYGSGGMMYDGWSP